MDANKAEVLREIDYTINPSCGLCLFASIKRGEDWGVCMTTTYQHLKHTGPPANLSIHRHGSCKSFQPKADIAADLHGFIEFLKEDA